MSGVLGVASEIYSNGLYAFGNVVADRMMCKFSPTTDPTSVLRLADLVSPTMTSLTLTGTTDSTSPLTGNLINAGGFGNAGALYNGGHVVVLDTTESTSTDTGSLIVSGGAGIAGNVSAKSISVITNNASDAGMSSMCPSMASSSSTPAIQFGKSASGNDCGVISYNHGSDGSLFNNVTVGLFSDPSVLGITTSTVAVTPTTLSSSTDTGALVVAGGLGVAGAIQAGTVKISSSDQSTSAVTGAMVVAGGIGVSGNLYVGTGGVTRIQNTTESTSSSTGALVCSGGAAINKTTYVGGDINMQGSTGSIRFSNQTTPKRIVLYNNAADDTTRFIGFGLDSYMLRVQLSSVQDGVSFRCGTG